MPAGGPDPDLEPHLAAFFGSLFALLAGPLGGSFITLDQCRSPEVWEADFELMDTAGLDTLIVREAVDLTINEAFYPTMQPNLASDCEYDSVGMVMAFAERHDMKVYLGLVHASGTSSPAPGWGRDQLLYQSALTARELVMRYGDYESFAGWYLTPEAVANDWVFDRNHHRIRFHRELVAAIREFDSHPIASAPYFIPYSTWQPISEQQMQDFVYAYTLTTGVNIVILQDGAGADNRSINDIGRYFVAASRGIANTGAQLWGDVEAFRIMGDGAFVPSGGDPVRVQSATVKPHVDKLVAWTFQHYMSPYAGRPGAWQAFFNYITGISAN
ncbi:MAG: DUF4434 domain-containing protein [Dehalococcoidia bacterium]